MSFEAQVWERTVMNFSNYTFGQADDFRAFWSLLKL